MYKPDKATMERNVKSLRELVKQSETKIANATTLGGHHGTLVCTSAYGVQASWACHMLAESKSIDLDIWTPDQMESIQKWGNRRANLYWEAHLKAGHIPPDHKMESYIHSKYETRRWALDGPPPSDPSVLEPTQSSANRDGVLSAPLLETSPVPTPSPSRSMHVPTASLSAPRPASPSVNSPTTFRQSTVHSHTQSRQLLSAAVSGRVSAPSPQQSQSPAASTTTANAETRRRLLSLDFHAPASKPASSPPQLPAKDVKQDILSLFSALAQSIQPSNAFGQFMASQSPWDALGQTHAHTISQQAPQPAMGMMGTSGVGHWGVSSGWTPNTAAANTSIWAAPAASTTSRGVNTLNTTDIWGGTTHASSGLFAQPTTAVSKKDGVFGDLWGDFK